MEKLESINERLALHFGRDIGSNRPIFRIVFSDDEREKRFGTWEDYDKNHTFIREVTETREVPKYPWIKGFYVLEQLVGVPIQNIEELAGKMISYEPLFVFKDNAENPLPPNFIVSKIVIDDIRSKLGQAGHPKYKDDSWKPEHQEARIKGIQKELFGNETPVGDALAHKSGVGYTSSPKIEVKE